MTEPAEGAPQRPAAGGRLRVRVDGAALAPVVSVRVWLRGGSRVERRPGEALVAGRLLAEGSRRRDYREIAVDAEDRGASIWSGAGLEYAEVAVDAPAAEWERALAWAAELVLEPGFAPERCGWLRRQAAAELAAALDDPAYRTAWGFLDQLYRPHPAGRPRAGDAASLGRLTPDGCRQHHRRAAAGGVIVAVAGRLDEAAVERRARELFASLEGTPAAPAEPPAPLGVAESPRTVALRPGEQVHLYLGRRTVPRGHPDLPALAVAGVVLGAGPGLVGRIPFRVRERDGLAYAVDVATVGGAGLDPGRFVVYCATSPDSADRARAAVAEELERALDGVDASEVDDARAFLLGREPFSRETAAQRAERLAEAELYGLPLDDPEWLRERLEAVDRRAVRSVLERWLGSGGLATTVGRPGR